MRRRERERERGGEREGERWREREKEKKEKKKKPECKIENSGTSAPEVPEFINVYEFIFFVGLQSAERAELLEDPRRRGQQRLLPAVTAAAAPAIACAAFASSSSSASPSTFRQGVQRQIHLHAGLPRARSSALPHPGHRRTDDQGHSRWGRLPEVYQQLGRERQRRAGEAAPVHQRHRRCPVAVAVK
jgi:hypothetical protein